MVNGILGTLWGIFGTLQHIYQANIFLQGTHNGHEFQLLYTLGPLPIQPPPLKKFTPKCPEIPVLKNYEFGVPKSFWDKFPVNRDSHGQGPYHLKADLILDRAIQSGVQNMKVVREVVNNIRNGCDLQVDRSSYTARRSENIKWSSCDICGKWVHLYCMFYSKL